MEKLLRMFGEVNFGHRSNYIPVTHGKTQEIRPLVLLVKQERKIWERPFKKYKYTTLGRLDKYMATGSTSAFQKMLNKCIKREDPDIVLDVSMDEEDEEDEEKEGAASGCAFDAEAANCFQGSIRISDELGFLVLGKLDQEYICDADLREILANAELDRNKIPVSKETELRLITSVVYSERFEHKGKISYVEEGDIGVNDSRLPYAQLRGHYQKWVIPPRIAARNTRGPLLFKCVRVEYDEETNRLNLPERVIVSRIITDRGMGDLEDGQELEEYENTAMDAEDESSVVAEYYTNEDAVKLEVIKKEVLIPTKDREERKARVNKYLSWFTEALSTGRKLFRANNLTGADHDFLESIYISAPPGEATVDFSNYDDEKVQGYAIVLKIIADLSEADWDEIEKAWEESVE